MPRAIRIVSCDVCSHDISTKDQAKRHTKCPECGRACQGEWQRLRREKTVPPVQARPDVPAELSDLAQQIRHALRKDARSRLDLANALDTSPKRIDDAITELSGCGYNLAVQESDGGSPQLFIERGAMRSKQLRIDAAKHFDGYRFDFGAVSDTHLCSKFYREEVLNAIYDNFAQHGIRHVFHGGNYIEGEKDHNRFHLLAHGMTGQVDYFTKNYPQRDGITTYFVAGDDHEGWYQQREGIDIGEYTQQRAEAAGRHDLINLGYMESDVAINVGDRRCVIRVMHGGGGSAYAISYTAQKLVESFEGGTKPQILLLGHYHKTEYLFYRNVHVLQLGTTKAQDTFMRKLRLAAHVAGWRCSTLIDKHGAIVEFTVTLLPFFDRGYYESLAIDGNGAVQIREPNETYNVVR